MGKKEKEKDTTEDVPQEQGEEIQIVPPSPKTPTEWEDELKKVNELLDEKSKEAAENYAKFLGACADLENYKKRIAKEKTELINFANERLVKELLPVADNLERAIDHIEDESNLSAIKDGVKLVLGGMLAALKKFGVEQLSSVGEKFDPSKHEAVTQEETDKYEPGIVIKELHKCYYLNKRLIRPAIVIISKSPDTPIEEEKNKTHDCKT